MTLIDRCSQLLCPQRYQESVQQAPDIEMAQSVRSSRSTSEDRIHFLRPSDGKRWKYYQKIIFLGSLLSSSAGLGYFLSLGDSNNTVNPSHSSKNNSGIDSLCKVSDNDFNTMDAWVTNYLGMEGLDDFIILPKMRQLINQSFQINSSSSSCFGDIVTQQKMVTFCKNQEDILGLIAQFIYISGGYEYFHKQSNLTTQDYEFLGRLGRFPSSSFYFGHDIVGITGTHLRQRGSDGSYFNDYMLIKNGTLQVKTPAFSAYGPFGNGGYGPTQIIKKGGDFYLLPASGNYEAEMLLPSGNYLIKFRHYLPEEGVICNYSHSWLWSSGERAVRVPDRASINELFQLAQILDGDNPCRFPGFDEAYYDGSTVNSLKQLFLNRTTDTFSPFRLVYKCPELGKQGVPAEFYDQFLVSRSRSFKFQDGKFLPELTTLLPQSQVRQLIFI